MSNPQTRAEQRAALIAAGAIADDTVPVDEVAPASVTPNVVVQNPKVRRIAGVVLGVGSLIVSGAMVLDATSPAFDWAPFTAPAAALVLFFAGAFQVGVTTPNVPR